VPARQIARKRNVPEIPLLIAGKPNAQSAPAGSNLPGIAVFFILAVWIYSLVWAKEGYPVYRDQHLGAALHYAAHGVDLLRPVIPGFNATNTGTPQELPLWQTIAGISIRAFGGAWAAATVVSLVAFFSFLPFFWWLVKHDSGHLSAWLALIFLLSQPLVFHLAGGAQTDGLSLALFIFFIWSSENLRREGGEKNFVICALAASLLALTKLPFLLAGGVAAALRLVFSHNRSLSSWLTLGLAGLIALLCFWAWNHWCEQEIGRALFRYRPLTFSEIPEWFLGSWEFRLDPSSYAKAGWRALACLWGSSALVGLTFYGLWKNPRSLGACLLYGAIGTTLIFTKLVFVHRHYYLMFAPAVALLNATALSFLFPHPKKVISFCLAPLLFLSLAQGLVNMEVVATGDPYPKRMGALIAAQTLPYEKVLVIGGGWGGNILLHAGRDGLSVDDSSLAENIETRRWLRQLGYTKFIWISESPLVHALQISNPGEATKPRARFPVQPSANTRSWPTIYQSDEIVIKELPGL